MIAPAALGSRQAAILEHLAGHPGLTAEELARAFGLRASLYKQLGRLQGMALITCEQVWNPAQGRDVTHWRVAPPGTVPPPPPPADPVRAERIRERARKTQRARRARARGLNAGRGMARRAAAPDFTRAACQATDPDLFFGPDAERVTDRQRRTAQAKGICAGCPVRAACLAYALDTGQAFGIWGAADEDERRAILRQAARRAS